MRIAEIETMLFSWYNQFDKLEFGGESPLTMRHELRQSNKIISRPVASFRSAYAFDKLEFDGGNIDG